MRHSENRKALSVIEEFSRRKRNHFPTETLLVRALICNEEYGAAERVLAKTRILPFEGAKDGINLQKHIKLMLAVDKMRKKQHKAALDKIEEAKLWPRNLGVGKPYDEVIDTRLEDWLSFVAAERGGLKGQREHFLQRLVGSNVNTPEYLLLQSAAWHIAGDETKARKLADGWFAAQKDETAHRNGKEFLEVVGRGEYASDTALDFYKPLIQALTAKADNRLF